MKNVTAQLGSDITFRWRNPETTVLDTSGNNLDGTPSGATLTTGKVGSALSFDGSNDFVNFGNDSSTDFTSENFTVSFWMYLEELPSDASAHYTVVYRGFYADHFLGFLVQCINLPVTINFDNGGIH